MKRFFYNNAGFLHVIAIADGALFEYESLEDVQAQEILSSQNECDERALRTALAAGLLSSLDAVTLARYRCGK